VTNDHVLVNLLLGTPQLQPCTQCRLRSEFSGCDIRSVWEQIQNSDLGYESEYVVPGYQISSSPEVDKFSSEFRTRRCANLRSCALTELNNLFSRVYRHWFNNQSKAFRAFQENLEIYAFIPPSLNKSETEFKSRWTLAESKRRNVETENSIEEVPLKLCNLQIQQVPDTFHNSYNTNNVTNISWQLTSQSE